MASKNLTAIQCILPAAMVKEKMEMLRDFFVYDRDGSIYERLSKCKTEMELDRVVRDIAVKSLG